MGGEPATDLLGMVVTCLREVLTLMHLGREAPPMMKDNGGAVALGRGRDIF
jgi:hypothetical protein